MQPPGSGKTGIERGIQHALPGPQRIASVLQRQALQKLLRSNPRPPGKQPMKVVRAEPRFASQFGERRLLQMMLIQKTDDEGNSIVVIHDGMLHPPRRSPTRFLRSFLTNRNRVT